MAIVHGKIWTSQCNEFSSKDQVIYELRLLKFKIEIEIEIVLILSNCNAKLKLEIAITIEIWNLN